MTVMIRVFLIFTIARAVYAMSSRVGEGSLGL